MLKVRYTPLAENDLDGIASYTTETLVKTPGLGRRGDVLGKGLKRIEDGSHVIFFMADEQGILVVRILHKQELPELHIC